MAIRKVTILAWDFAVPHLNRKVLSLPYEGLVEGDGFTRDDLSPAQQESIRKDIDAWFSDLPAELDRIAKAASSAFAGKTGKFEHAEAERVLCLVEKLRSIKSVARRRDVMAGYLLGRRTERLGVLPCERHVRARRGSDEAIGKINREKRARDLKAEAQQAIEQVKREYPDRTNMKFIKGEAARRIGPKGISVSGLNKRLRNR